VPPVSFGRAWVYEFPPVLPDKLLKRWKHSAAVIEKVYVNRKPAFRWLGLLEGGVQPAAMPAETPSAPAAAEVKRPSAAAAAAVPDADAVPEPRRQRRRLAQEDGDLGAAVAADAGNVALSTNRVFGYANGPLGALLGTFAAVARTAEAGEAGANAHEKT
jgi:hypothetical protein